MKLAPHQVHRPTSVADALGLLGELGDDAVLYAGGTELLLVMKLGLADYRHLIDLKRVEGIPGIEFDNDRVTIGSTVTHLQVERDATVRRRFPALATMVSGIGNLRVRNTGTLGGNLAFADPHSDPATFLTALDGTVSIANSLGATRECPVAELTLGAYTTVLAENEMITTISVPLPQPGTAIVHKHVRFRERPALTITVSLRRSGEELADVRVSVGSVCAAPVRLEAVERLVRDQGTDVGSAIRQATMEQIEPVDDLDGSAAYKSHLMGEMVVRCVEAALDSSTRATGGSQWN